MRKNINRRLGVALIGASVLGSVAAGVVAATPASAAATTQSVSATADRTRGFDIVNMTKHTLQLSTVTNPGDRDGYAPVLTSISPGQAYHYEKVYYFGKYSETTLKFQYTENNVIHNAFDATISVDWFGGTKILTDAADYGQFSVSNEGWNGRLDVMEKHASSIVVPASDAQKQAEILNQTCVSGLASCSFHPTSKVDGQPIVKLVAGGANNTATARTETFTTKTIATETSSVEIAASAKATVKGIFEAGVTWKYGAIKLEGREDTRTHNYTMSPYTNFSMFSRVPTDKVTGYFYVVLGKTAWELKDVTFDIPNKDGTVLYDTSERALTEQEKTSLPHLGGIKPLP